MANPEPCRWIPLREAMENFAFGGHTTQSARHIKPLHWYIACRLVLEGGIDPHEITPRPPFIVKGTKPRPTLVYDRSIARGHERTLFGGLKTKNVDVVVTKEGIGPVIAISMKGTLNAFRNLTNRMEEAVGDCTNLHIAYPALVYGFLHILRVNVEGDNVAANDVFVLKDGTVSENINRYHDVMVRLSGRVDIRNDVSRYEAVSLIAAETSPEKQKDIKDSYPFTSSPLHFNNFLSAIYTKYDERFVYAAPALKSKTQRMVWNPNSPAFSEIVAEEFEFRTS